MRLYLVEIDSKKVTIRAPNANEARWSAIEEHVATQNKRPQYVKVLGYYGRNNSAYQPLLEGRSVSYDK